MNEIDKEIIDVLIAWDKLEVENFGKGVIDFNLLDDFKSFARFKNRLEVLNRLKNIKQKLDSNDQRRLKVIASITYLRSLMGEQIPFSEYILQTQNVPVVEFGEETTNEIKNEIVSLANELNLGFNKDLIKGLNVYEGKISKDEIIKLIESVFNDKKPFFEEFLGRAIDFKIDFELVKNNEYWSYWVDGNYDKFRLRLNQNNLSLTKVEASRFVYHELLAHCTQMDVWRDNIERNKMSPIWGITTVYGPEQFLFEGIAQTLPLFVLSSIEKKDVKLIKLRILVSLYSSLINNNIHLKINNGKAIEEVIDYKLNFVPWAKEDDIFSDLISRSYNPLYRSYQFVYPISFLSFYRIANKSNLDKTKFLKKAYNEFMSYDMIMKEIE